MTYPDEVLRQQEAVRRSGAVNMFDRAGVEEVARQLGHDELVDWLQSADASEYIDMARRAAEEHRPE